ncbi:ABC transporter permease [Gorillibacterium massiliense]|uniref:ABC transporter permease n=1 Tax=Gorillibacterium massiliense TaxID=1280390 RepID=UPI0004BAB092|nr:ABC transporter permease [Gorillibacterium massiliense]
MKIDRLWRAALPPTLVLVLFLLLWEGAAAVFHIPKWQLPAPTDIFREGWNGFGRIGPHTLSTLKITLLGFIVGSLTGVVIAVALHLIPGVRQGFYPLLILSQNIPLVALAPLLMIWFGLGLLPKLILITLVCFFPVAVALLDGFSQTDAAMMDYMRMIGASRSQIFRKLELPHAVPFLFSGLKISATYSVMGAVVAEWLGAEKGIGVYMLNARSSYRADRVFVAMFVIVVISLLLFGLISLIEKRTVRWKPKRERQTRR